MPNNLTGDITPTELYNCIAFEYGGNCTIESARRFYYALKKVILKQLELNHRIRLPEFGIFEDKITGGYNRITGNPAGGTRIVYFKPKPKVRFKSSNVLIQDIQNDYAMKYTIPTNKVQKKKRKRNKNEMQVYKERKIKEEIPFDAEFAKLLNKKAKRMKQNKEQYEKEKNKS